MGEGVIDVRMQAPAACEGCGICTTGTSGETIMRDVRDTLGALVGDTVEVDIPDSVKGRAVVAVFLVPVVALLAGYLAGFLLGSWLHLDRDLVGLILALVAGSVAFLGVRRAEYRIAESDRFSPHVSAIIARGHGGP